MLSATATLLLMGGCGLAQAQSSPASSATQSPQADDRSFDIPAQPLARALSAFYRQSGIQVSQASGAVNGNVTTVAVKGRFTPQQALAQMLGGTGVAYRFTGNRAAVIGGGQKVDGIPAEDGATVLGPIVVTSKGGRNVADGAGFQGTPDWVYEAPASVSVVSREAVQATGSRNTRDLLDTVAGVMTNRAEGQNPGVQVNIRGLQDNNRITTMIDGARQNFQRGGHGGSQQVYVDQSFIRTVEVEKISGSGVGGAGSLGGSVDFRTITAGDIIQPGEKWGGEFTAGSGTNASYFDGNLLAGYRFSEDFSVLGGVSRKRLGNYKVGQDLPVRNTVVDSQVLSTGYESYGSLLKFEGAPADDFKFDISWLRYDIDSTLIGTAGANDQRYMTNTVNASFSWDPDSDLIDMKGRVWFNETSNDELRNYNIVDPVSYGMRSFGASLENTSRFDLPAGTLSINYGAEAYRDIGKTDAIPRVDQNGVDGSYGYKGMNPSGRFDMASGFLNATLEHDDWLMVRGGVRYDHYSLSGTTQVVGAPITVLVSPQQCIVWIRPNRICGTWRPAVYQTLPAPHVMMDVDKSGGAWLPSATIAVKPFDWIQPFVSYTESYRPPSILETLMSGGHPNVTPNDNMPNPYLRPEQGKTWEIGANITRDGLLSADDRLRLKAVWFDRRVTDYISQGFRYYDAFNRYYFSNVNLDGTTRIRGLELEASYDLGMAYAGLSYTRTNTDLASTFIYNGPPGADGSSPTSPPQQGENEANPSVLFVLPKQRFTIDAGLRLFDERFVIGARTTYVEETAPTIGQLASTYRAESYRLYDVYGSYAFNEQAKLRFAVNNITNEGYWPALGASETPSPGRTFTASLNVKF